jgi:hypothetical protein
VPQKGKGAKATSCDACSSRRLGCWPAWQEKPEARPRKKRGKSQVPTEGESAEGGPAQVELDKEEVQDISGALVRISDALTKLRKELKKDRAEQAALRVAVETFGHALVKHFGAEEEYAKAYKRVQGTLYVEEYGSSDTETEEF